MKKTDKQKGAVSLFVVIFAALLITVVTVSFIRIMIQNQQQATANDLSQSAYDSAQAGVEDAKRAILLYMNKCNGSGDCALTTIDSPTCNDAVRTLSDVPQTGNEIPVKTSSNDSKLNQAYTCVKIMMQTDDYLGSLALDGSTLIPLVGVDNFDTIKIDWFNSKDLQGNNTTVDLPPVGMTALQRQANWIAAINRPSVMRAQIIMFDGKNGFKNTDFDILPQNSDPHAFTNTLFLYPSSIIRVTATQFSYNIRPTESTSGSPGEPIQEGCISNLNAGGYACSATLNLSHTIGSNDYKAYLFLKSFYKKSNFRITLFDSTKPGKAGDPGKSVKFNGVQPSIDSTGRANDLFRRVQTRVEFRNTNFPYPQGAVNIKGNLCKNFSVTDKVDDFTTINSSAQPCNPSL